MKRRIGLFALLLGLTYLFYWRGLSFTFWKDDWYYLWSALYAPQYLASIWLHPATTIEFFALSRVFGQNPVLWQHAGLFLRAGAALAVMDMTAALFGSATIAWMSAVIFVTTPLGMEAVNWPSAHVTLLITLLFCEATALYMRSLSGRKRLLDWAAVLYLLSFLSDPLRVASLLWVPLFLGYGKRIRLSKIFGVAILLCMLIGGYALLPFYRLWYHDHIVGFVLTPKVLRIGFHYPNVLWNVITGWIVPVPHIANEISHSVFQRLSAVLGSICVLLVIVFARRNRRLLFAAVWILATIAVQWFPEPRLIPATAHRYFVLPSVGLALLFGWAIGRISSRIKWIVVFLYLVISWHTTGILLGEMAAFRTKTTVDGIWQTIVAAVAPREVAPIIFTMGEEPMKTNVVEIDAVGHYNLISWNRGIHQSALFTTDGALIRDYLCQHRYTLSDVYAFSIYQSGIARNDSKLFREKLAKGPKIAACIRVTMQ